MSANGADKAGLILAFFIGLSILVSAFALLLHVIRWW